MSNENVEQKTSLLQTIFNKFTGKKAPKKERRRFNKVDITDEERKTFEVYDQIRQNPEELTGWDFDRAFDFLEKHPESIFAEKLDEQMRNVCGSALKGLSYPAAVKVLQRMPDHPGTEAIIRGIKKMESEYIVTLRSDVISYILEILPEHPLAEELATALAVKNLTNAYTFIENNPLHPCTPMVIQAMFDRDANIATLLLHERIDHPRVDAIFAGIYSIREDAALALMPDAIAFILDIASDHPHAEQMCQTLVEKNYVKACDYVKNNDDHPYAEQIAEMIAKEHPSVVRQLSCQSRKS